MVSSSWWMILQVLYPLLYIVAIVLIAQWPTTVDAKMYFFWSFFLGLLINMGYSVVPYIQGNLRGLAINYYIWLSIGQLGSLILLLIGIASLKNNLMSDNEQF